MIHDENPFASTTDDPVRRFRGRLAAGVCVVTSGTPAHRTGLTVSSIMVIEGQPPTLVAVVGPNSDLYDIASASGSFVVHQCGEGDLGLADVFAGVRPSPGGSFAGLTVLDTRWGPVIDSLPTRAFCSEAEIEPLGWSGLMRGKIDKVEIVGTSNPLVHYRGEYRGLA